MVCLMVLVLAQITVCIQVLSSHGCDSTWIVLRALDQNELKMYPCCCQRFEEDAVEASVMMMHTFNKDREKVKVAVDIISK